MPINGRRMPVATTQIAKVSRPPIVMPWPVMQNEEAIYADQSTALGMSMVAGDVSIPAAPRCLDHSQHHGGFYEN